MDHLPLPSTNAIAHLTIPYLAQLHPGLQYDNLGFIGFPSRIGFNADRLIRANGERTTAGEQACVLQSWCFFGLTIEVYKAFGLKITIQEFIRLGDDGHQWLDTSLIADLLRSVEELTRSVDLNKRSEIYCSIKPWLVTSGIVVRRLAQDDTEDSIGSKIHLSTLLIGEHLWHAISVYLQCTDPTPNPWWARNSLPPRLMTEAGWCPSLSMALLDEEVSQSFIYSISRIDQRNAGMDHVNCTSENCVLDKLDLDKYRTKHTEDCGAGIPCPGVALEPSQWAKLLMIVDEKQIPLITVQSSDNGENVIIEADSSQQYFVMPTDSLKLTAIRQYVCISHVWSE